MLALHNHSLRRLSATSVPYHAQARSSTRRFFMQSLCDGFLDLAIALPLPPSLPPYSTTIILVTVVTRLALLPVSVWGKRRTHKIEDVILPEINKLKPAVSKQVLAEMKQAGIRGDKRYLQDFHARRSIQILTARRKELFKEYNCRPLPSIIAPPLSQLPFFVITTVALGRLSLDPTPFDSESFLTLTTLAHPDPTLTLPIILGILTMANVESSNWVMNAAEREREQQIEEKHAKRIADGGKPHIQPKKVLKTVLRILSVGRIILASITPGSITLYWVTSSAFGLIQTWYFDWLDIRRRRLRSIPAHSSSVAQPTSMTAPTSSLPPKLRR